MVRDTPKLDLAVISTFTLKLDSLVKINNNIQIYIPKSQLKPISVEPTCKFKVGSDYQTEGCKIVI
jgi:hypothetical protein